MLYPSCYTMSYLMQVEKDQHYIHSLWKIYHLQLVRKFGENLLCFSFPDKYLCKSLKKRNNSRLFCDGLLSSLRFKKAARDGEEGRNHTKTSPGVMHLAKESSFLCRQRVSTKNVCPRTDVDVWQQEICFSILRHGRSSQRVVKLSPYQFAWKNNWGISQMQHTSRGTDILTIIFLAVIFMYFLKYKPYHKLSKCLMSLHVELKLLLGKSIHQASYLAIWFTNIQACHFYRIYIYWLKCLPNA